MFIYRNKNDEEEKSMKYQHYCVEWDDMLIDETCPEFACCLCFEGEEFEQLRREANETHS